MNREQLDSLPKSKPEKQYGSKDNKVVMFDTELEKQRQALKQDIESQLSEVLLKDIPEKHREIASKTVEVALRCAMDGWDARDKIAKADKKVSEAKIKMLQKDLIDLEEWKDEQL